MALPLLAIGKLMAAILAVEGIQATLDKIVGDPEADVALALKQLAATNQRRVVTTAAADQLAEEDLQSKFSDLNRIPGRSLATQSLLSTPLGASGNLDRDTSLVDMVSQKLQMGPGRLQELSAPNRSGDLTGVMRSLKKPLPE